MIVEDMLLEERSHIMINASQKVETDISGLEEEGTIFFLTCQCLPVVNSTLFDTIL